MDFKTLKRSFGFEYEGQFVSGTLIRHYDTEVLSAYLFVNGEEFSTLDDWKKDTIELNKFKGELESRGLLAYGNF